MKYKVRLLAEVTVTAAADVVVEVDNIDEAREAAIEQAKAQDETFLAQLRAYHRNISLGYPSRPFSWDVDGADVDEAIDWNVVEADDVTEVKE